MLILFFGGFAALNYKSLSSMLFILIHPLHHAITPDSVRLLTR